MTASPNAGPILFLICRSIIFFAFFHCILENIFSSMFIDLCVKGVTYHNELQVLIQIMFHWEKKIVSQVVGW